MNLSRPSPDPTDENLAHSLTLCVGLPAPHTLSRIVQARPLTFTLVISTAARHDLGDEARITVRIERMGHGGRGFCILYHGDGDWADRVGALVKTYGTDDYKVIEASLRRDLTGYYYPCEFAEGSGELFSRSWCGSGTKHTQIFSSPFKRRANHDGAARGERQGGVGGRGSAVWTC